MGMEVVLMETTHRSAVIIATHIEAFEPLVRKAGYEVKGVANTLVNGERLVEFFTPDVVLVENNLTGEQGWSGLARLATISPSSKPMLVVADHWTPNDVGATGAFAVVRRDDPRAITDCLHDIDSWITIHLADGNDSDRRAGRDRRLHQDWSKVGWERRKTPPRRVDDQILVS